MKGGGGCPWVAYSDVWTVGPVVWTMMNQVAVEPKALGFWQPMDSGHNPGRALRSELSPVVLWGLFISTEWLHWL